MTKEIYFAGGCFWGVEEYFSRMDGVISTEVGYANGNTPDPTYEDVCYKNTGYAEAVKIVYDPGVIALQTLVGKFFGIIDPTALNRQGNDVGSQYRSGIYYVDAGDEPVIERLMQEEQKKYKRKILTELLPIKTYYPAEEYHQAYLKKNPGGYCHIRLDNV